MAKRPNRVLQKNARQGAITRWCPNCKRYNALSAQIQQGGPSEVLIKLAQAGEPLVWRECRYCGHTCTDRERITAHKAWVEEQEGEDG